MYYIGHIKKLDKEKFGVQFLVDHLAGTAKLASEFAKNFNSKAWGDLIGKWHDLGKYSEEFQQYILASSGYEEGEKLGKTDHTSTAAILAKEIYPGLLPPIAYCIAGHHAGLHNWLPEYQILKLDLLKYSITEEEKDNYSCGQIWES
jgi:CRISPR-associated endonuclease/helicase Cas3